MEYRLRGRGGTYRWFVARGKPMLDASGAVLRWYGGVTDIDDLKKAEAAVLRSATVFRNLADSLPQIVWVADATGCNTYLNRRWYEYTGIDPSSVHSLQAVAHPDDFESTMEAWREAVALGAIFETEYRLKRHDGRIAGFSVAPFPREHPTARFRSGSAAVPISRTGSAPRPRSRALTSASIASRRPCSERSWRTTCPTLTA